jgi:hypothetical protein
MRWCLQTHSNLLFISITFENILYNRDSDAFWSSMGDELQASASQYPSLPPISITSQTDFLRYFQMRERNVVLLVDEFSELYHAQDHIRDDCLRTFRGIRSHPVGYAIHSIIMAGTFSILHLNPADARISPFNISEDVANPYFDLDETRKLFSLFAKDKGIMIDDDVVDDVWFQSNG